MTSLPIVLAQLNFVVGDITGNTQKMLIAISKAIDEKAKLIIFPELAITSYPPEDLLLRNDLYFHIEQALNQLMLASKKIDIVVGYPKLENGLVFNAASWFQNGKIIASYNKQILPNTGVFDEKRYFTKGQNNVVVNWEGMKVGLLICEDIWHSIPISNACQAGAKFIIAINASPYSQTKETLRKAVIKKRCEEQHLSLLYVNHIGGQDDLLFDGNSMAVNKNGDVAAQAVSFKEQLLTVYFDSSTQQFLEQALPNQSSLSVIYDSLVIGVQDYINKNNFPGVIIGLSGGIDSALTLAIAVDALGKERVQAVMMPSQYTADISQVDAKSEADALGVEYSIISIEPMYKTFIKALSPSFKNRPIDKTEENLQARIRGTLLMALSNKTGRLVLTTGNKSEMAVGYATLYGDMAGGYCVLKDVYKTLVYQLAHYRNTLSSVIPQRVIDRAPSAELAPNQTDQDSLPPYEVLDEIIRLFVEEDKSISDIVKKGFDLPTVKKVISMIYRNEYKRRQAPIGPRITERAFGRNRRYPITSGFLKLL